MQTFISTVPDELIGSLVVTKSSQVTSGREILDNVMDCSRFCASAEECVSGALVSVS